MNRDLNLRLAGFLLDFLSIFKLHSQEMLGIMGLGAACRDFNKGLQVNL